MQSDLEEIKNRLDIVDVLSDYVPLKKSGQNWKGLCPFHTEKTPSFTVSPAKQIYYCFGCSSGGDIFTFLMKHESLSFSESLTVLAKKAGVSLRRGREKKASGEKEVFIDLHREAHLFYTRYLSRSAPALAYLKERGITPESLKTFSLGFSPNGWDGLLTFLRRKGYSPEMIVQAGLAVQGTRGYYDTFRKRIIFPIFNVRDEVVGFGGRVMDNSLPKYLNSPETPIFNKSRILYGLNVAKNEIRKRGHALIVEGYLDVITAHMHGFTHAVAPLGTAVTGEHGKLLSRFTDEAVIVFDGDESGLNAAKSGMAVLLESGLDVKVLALPEGEDPDSILKRGGQDVFSRLLKSALPLVDFFLSCSRRTSSGKGDDRSIIREVLQAVSRIPDSGLQGYYVKKLSEALNINEVFLREELMKIRRKHSSRNERISGAGIPPTPRARPMDEMYLLQLVLQFPDMAKDVFSTITPEDLDDSLTREIFIKMKKGILSYNDLLTQCDEEGKNLLSELMFRSDIENPERVFLDCAKRIQSKKHQIVLRDLQRRIKEAEREKDDRLLRTLLEEKQKQLHSKGQ